MQPVAALKVFVLGLFTVIGVLFFVMQKREADMFSEIQSILENQLEGIEFYKDGLRDSESLNLPLTDKNELNEFLSYLKIMKPSNRQIRLLTRVAIVKIRFKTNTGRLLQLTIHQSVETGNMGVISLAEIGSVVETPGGVYESAELLGWTKKISEKKGYENIFENYQH